MSATPTVSDHLLLTIWHASLLLALLSVIILFTLIVRRWLEGRNLARQNGRVAELSLLIKAALAAPVEPPAESLPPITARDRPLVRIIALNTLRSIMGADADRMLAILRVWGMEQYLRQELQSSSRGLRVQALTLLAHFPSEETTALLLQHVNEIDPYVQMAALRGLALPEHASQLPAVIRILAESPQRNTAMLADILQRFGPLGVPSLVKLTKRAKRVEMRLAAITALARIGDFAAVPVLSELCRSKNPEIRAAAVEALGQLGATSESEVILKALDDRQMPVLIQAARVAGRFQIQEAVPLLSNHLQAEEWWLRFRAAEALYLIGGPGVTLLQAFSKQNDRAGRIAAAMLAEKGSSLA